MSMLDRIKKRQIDGFKEFVINMETTGAQTRSQIFTAGILEDPIFMSYVVKNIRTFNNFLELDTDDIDTVLRSQEQLIALFAKCFFGADEAKILSLASIIPRHISRFKDELSYLKEVTASEKEGAEFFLMKITRKFQMEERIKGFPWKLPSQDIYYAKQMKDGDTKIYFENGVVAAEGNYQKGNRMGAWKHHYDTGNILAEGDYSNGNKVGAWVFYYNNGKLKLQGKYKDDLRHGMWKEWDRNGNLLEIEYLEGVRK